ncbi:nucleoside kinase [Clostridium folliculivorans]|uniref:Threonyl-tRNA synthetase/uridine kinase n=1 Tax=Clostridium folliculivorans TaxID=2886038 RepID=A0A9W5Y5P3_9CLOT|nr:nucleoside kinase [Clostridium folliculivorans]GKU27118.1 threonyl-tRNA synthetase/uridine kinase [Clostridium folliculivorans]GKU31735.1 threonyl-tRNA synthetase/uridine kinase [Clostridium folliculivorans]
MVLRLEINNQIIEVEKGTTFNELVNTYYQGNNVPIVLGKLNNKYYELSCSIEESGKVQFIAADDRIGNRAYARTLQFLFIKATLDLFPGAKITIEHSLSKGIFGEVHMEKALDAEDIILIKKKMNELIEKDIQIKTLKVKKEEAIKIFSSYGMEDKLKLLKNLRNNELRLYELDGRYDYFYGKLGYSTGVIKYYELTYHEPGFLLRFPEEGKGVEIPVFEPQEKLEKIFQETEQWLNILDIADVGSLNEKVIRKEFDEIIRVSEALHEKKIAYIADMIHDRNEVKIVLIAGPSSSGKTTFSKRLAIQLRVNGLIPIPISLDDYFIDRDKTKLDEEGKPDFESIYALDLELFNKQLNLLLEGEKVTIPSYNFKTGTRDEEGHDMQLPQNGVLIIEGIHGLNDMLTSTIPDHNKFKIYISALTQLNVDNHNRIATADVRKIRRIVRDFLSRGYGGDETLKMWPSIKRGEERNIFVYQEQADVMFNSTLVYELSVLKNCAIEELSKISQDSEVYNEAERLIDFLKLFEAIDSDMVPENSILREFIGGSCFYKY